VLSAALSGKAAMRFMTQLLERAINRQLHAGSCQLLLVAG
jgi:hypothetical protein